MPKVSIIMPVYNGEKYLKSAVKSVLDQSFQDYEFIVIDDGSNDCTRSILLGCKDNRIKLIRNITHRGISFALNQGLSLASGELIMRMDADDICEPQSILKQVHFMDQHTDIDVCGSDTELIDEKGKVIGYRNTKKGDQQIKIALLLGECSLAHPAVVVRRA